MNKETGGPAFPNVPSDIQYETWDEGMTLRDYFAVRAMQSIIEIGLGNGIYGIGSSYKDDTEEMAATSYFMADAMLAERSKP